MEMIERTSIIIKPSAVKRGRTFVDLIFDRFARAGIAIIQKQSFKENITFWRGFYPADKKWLRNIGNRTPVEERVQIFKTEDAVKIGSIIKDWVVRDMASGIVVAAILEGNDIRNKARLICGATLPNLAAPGTIRFDFSSDTPDEATRQKRSVRNIIHCANPNDELRDGKNACDFEMEYLSEKFSK